MTLVDLYPQVRALHIGLVLASGCFFLLRGVGVLRGSAWPMRPAIRRCSYGIDIALLGAALALLHILRLNPFATGWLAMKLLLLLVYIVLGSYALKRAKSTKARTACLLSAVACFAFMLTVARAHSPWGVLTSLS